MFQEWVGYRMAVTNEEHSRSLATSTCNLAVILGRAWEGMHAGALLDPTNLL